MIMKIIASEGVFQGSRGDATKNVFYLALLLFKCLLSRKEVLIELLFIHPQAILHNLILSNEELTASLLDCIDFFLRARFRKMRSFLTGKCAKSWCVFNEFQRHCAKCSLLISKKRSAAERRGR